MVTSLTAADTGCRKSPVDQLAEIRRCFTPADAVRHPSAKALFGPVTFGAASSEVLVRRVAACHLVDKWVGFAANIPIGAPIHSCRGIVVATVISAEVVRPRIAVAFVEIVRVLLLRYPRPRISAPRGLGVLHRCVPTSSVEGRDVPIGMVRIPRALEDPVLASRVVRNRKPNGLRVSIVAAPRFVAGGRGTAPLNATQVSIIRQEVSHHDLATTVGPRHPVRLTANVVVPTRIPELRSESIGDQVLTVVV